MGGWVGWVGGWEEYAVGLEEEGVVDADVGLEALAEHAGEEAHAVVGVPVQNETTVHLPVTTHPALLHQIQHLRPLTTHRHTRATHDTRAPHTTYSTRTWSLRQVSSHSLAG